MYVICYTAILFRLFLFLYWYFHCQLRNFRSELAHQSTEWSASMPTLLSVSDAAWWRSAVAYFQEFTRTTATSLLSTDSGPQSPTVCSFLLSDCLLSVAAPFLSVVLVCGTIYRRTLHPHPSLCSHLNSDWNSLIRYSYRGQSYTNCFSPTFNRWAL